MMSCVEKVAKEYKIIINAAKTKIMRNTDNAPQIRVESGILKQVDCFVYLGSKVTKDADYMTEVKTRLVMYTAMMIKLTKPWKYKTISTAIKLCLMEALVWPVATYGCESLMLKKEMRTASRLLRIYAQGNCHIYHG